MNTPELRQRCAQQLQAAADRSKQLNAFIGLDGFVDEILHVVDKRDTAVAYKRMPTIGHLAERLAGAAGKSTNLELVNQLTKLGGNGPIMANAMASFGIKVSYLGTLGYPTLHPVFHEFSRKAELFSIAEPGHTDALEFEDGKIMLGKHSSLKEMNWENIQSRFGRDKFTERFARADIVAFVNWTMLPHMSAIWAAIQSDICPQLNGPRRKLFFDLADPEKRTKEDILGALELIKKFEKHFDVILGLNEKEACEVGSALGLSTSNRTRDGLAELGLNTNRYLALHTLVIHPVTYALAVSRGKASVVEGPFVATPVITTGAGDHFNSGFCLGRMLGLDDASCVLTGVATSGFYVRTARSPGIDDLAGLLGDWPTA